MNFSFNNDIGGLLATPMMSWVVVMWLVTAIINISFAVAVLQDAVARRHAGEPIVLVNEYIWLIAVLAGGILSAAIYWLMHHSTLGKPSFMPMTPASARSAPPGAPARPVEHSLID